MEKAGRTPTEAKGTKGGYTVRWAPPPSSISHYPILTVHLIVDTMADSRNDKEIN